MPMNTATIESPVGLIQNKYQKKEEIAVSYVLYARKSSEDDERQALSIDSQINEMMQMAQREGLNVVEIRKESHSAKASGQRPEFNRLLNDVRDGMFNGILTWAADRLSRNAGDLGTIVDLMDQGFLHDIRTYGQQFRNSPNEKFLLMILCSQAKLENDNRGINIKRGMRARCEMGVRPGAVPLGYKLIRNPEKLNEPSKIIIDEERAPFIKKMFEYVINGVSGRQVHEYMIDEKFRTKKGKKLTLGMIFKIFKEEFYYGEFEYPKGSGNYYKGLHEPLITKEQFEQVNKSLVTYKKSKWGSKNFYFNKIFKCGYCGSGICGEEKINRHGKRYVYYRCNRYGGNRSCDIKHVREEKIIESIAKLVDNLKNIHVNLEKKISREVEKFNSLNLLTSNSPNVKQISSEDYIAYILKEGSPFEKKNILCCIDGQLVLEGAEVKVKN